MFKRHKLQVSVVKTPKNEKTNTNSNEPNIDTFDKITKIVEDNAAKAAVGFVAVYSAIRVVNAACTIAENAAPKKH